MKSGLLALSAILFACLGITAAAPKVASAWYPSWRSTFPPSKVPWDKYTNMNYAFILTTPDPGMLDIPPDFKTFVDEAKKHDVKVMASIGGWTGSRHFSTAVGSEDNRTAFVKAVTSLTNDFALDGVDFDWEFPNGKGVGCNAMNPNDTANFLKYLQELRDDSVGQNLLLSAAAGTSPWLNEEGNPVTDVSDFAKVLDYVAIMNYDVWGLGDTNVGPNSPLNDTCGTTTHGSGSLAVETWTNAGMPPDQIVLGVAYYGHSFRVSKENSSELYATVDDPSHPPQGDQFDGIPGEIDVCGVTSDSYGGIIQYVGMINDTKYFDVNGELLPNRTVFFDDCSNTPFVHNLDEGTTVSYDNAESMGLKGKFIKDKGLRGFGAWEVSGDNSTTLVDALLQSI